MSSRRVLVCSLLALIVALGLAAGPPLAGPASAVEVLADGGFEATVPQTTRNPYWEAFDSVYSDEDEGPLCRPDNYCDNGDDGRATARTGLGWVWFGYGVVAGQTGWARQSVTIPYGQATLSYWYRFGRVSAPFDATLTVSVDGTAVDTTTEPVLAQGGYVQHVVDVSAWADGAAHVLRFDYAKPTNGRTSATVDDVSLDVDPDVAPPETSITAAVPGGIAKSLTVPVGFAASEVDATFTCSLDGA